MSASNEGKQFEDDWKGSYEKTPYFFMRLRDGAKWVQSQESAFTPENPCDGIQHSMPFLWLLELKSTKGASVGFFPNTPWIKPKEAKGNPMIKANQVKELMDAGMYEGVIAGFVINFRERVLTRKTVPTATYFVHIHDFTSYAVESGSASLSQEVCEKIGVFIPARKKVKYYKYDIAHFVDAAAITYIKRGYIKIEHLKKLQGWLDIIIMGGVSNEPSSV